MTLLDIAQLGQTIEAARHDLFRWETLPAYEVAADGTDYRNYLDGAAEPTWERKQPWLDTLRAWASEGRSRRRVRIIHDPITSYERYACEWGYALNSRAGELIRILDLAEGELPHELTAALGMDFWLVDGRDVIAMRYAPDGQFRGAEVVDSQYAAPFSHGC
ncbi:MAG: hypothetical protein GEU83_09455 [Pseudonocardiaceae bacterium]|nr:hypothetical protein [Pseudonocardiaceae bacterium]